MPGKTRYTVFGALSNAIVSLPLTPMLFSLAGAYCGYKLKRIDRNRGLNMIALSILFLILALVC